MTHERLMLPPALRRTEVPAVSVAGIDFSSRAVDVVLLDEDSDAATWHRFDLLGANAFDRAREVRDAMRRAGTLTDFFEETLAIGIEEPRGYNAGALYRIQGAILASLPSWILVHPLVPSAWRKTVGLPGNASKAQVAEWALDRWEDYPFGVPFDGTDAYCIALATRSLLQHGERAA